MNKPLAGDGSEPREPKPETAGKESSAAGEMRNAGTADLKAAEANRTNASNGSLQDRRRLAAAQDSSIEIVGESGVASRYTKLTEQQLEAASYTPGPGGVEAKTDSAGHGTLVDLGIQKIGDRRYSIGIAYDEQRSAGEKFADFLRAATARLTDPKEQEQVVQAELNKLVGIGEGLYTAKEDTKRTAALAWKAITDGSVASYLAQPNVINSAIGKGICTVFHTMASDPDARNHILGRLGNEIVSANNRYNAMSPREQGRFIGEQMFSMFGPEAGSAGELSEEVADSAATQFEKISAKGEPQHEKLYLSGAGGDWPTINERPSSDVVKQCHPNACVSACGEMLTDGAIKQEKLVEEFKHYYPAEMLREHPTADLAWLERELGGDWTFTGIGPAKSRTYLDRLLKQGDRWAAEFRGGGKTGHIVVVDGENEAGEIRIMDPQDGTRYEMTKADFSRVWSGRFFSQRKRG